jgi:D-amino-acid dehydrogenase
LVFSRLGNRLRIAGTAELNGYNLNLNDIRCQALIKRTAALFPNAADYSKPLFWRGLRPATPSNVPYIGKTKFPNLYLNTGHGTLGWTHACGSAQAIADIIDDKKPNVEFDFV